VGSLAGVPMPGGAAAIRQPWRMALAYLDAAYEGSPPDDLAVMERNVDRWAAVRSLVAAGVNAPTTSSVGRLFDAVAAVLGVRDTVTYEGQAAIELERLADPAVADAYPVDLRSGSDRLVLDGPGLLRAVVEDLRGGTPPAAVAARFHASVAALTVAACRSIRAATGIGRVALTGGVWQNVLLLDHAVPALERDGFAVLTHARVPANDGGISLGQAAVAAALTG
jgi:hydrogenase maturation protein HypF